jgi:hypothetical protein
MPLLLHQPPLFDILPLYVIFLAVMPWLLAIARRHGWGMILTVSALGWLAAQCKLDVRLIGDPTRLLPLRWGSFDLLAWQFLWVCGLALGETSFAGQSSNLNFASGWRSRPSPSCSSGCCHAAGFGRRLG